MLSRSQMLREYRAAATGRLVCVEVAYSKGIYYGPRGYWLHIYPCERRGDMRIITMAQGSKRLIAKAERLTKKGLADAAWIAEGWLLRDDPAVRDAINVFGEVTT